MGSFIVIEFAFCQQKEWYKLKHFPGALVNGHSIFGEGSERLGEISGGKVTVDLLFEEAKTLDKFLSESDL